MAYNEQFADRVREIRVHQDDVEEKKMMGYVFVEQEALERKSARCSSK